MSRYIKFRFWSGNKMFFNDDINTWECLRQQFCKDPKKIGYDHIKNHNSYFMQFTGLKDKNGKDIYEGDIVKHKKEKEYKEVYFDTELLEFGLKQSNELFHCQFSNEFEVIGNIYENPVLLEEKTND